jgi:hypothetical protein
MNQSRRVFLFVAGALLLTSCASIQSGTTQLIKVSSNPAGATVYTATFKDKVISNKGVVGVTPVSVALSRKDGIIILEKEGYEPIQLDMKTKMNPWVWGDIILGSMLSTSIDTSTGASREYDPGEYMVDLKPVAAKQ